MFTTQFVPPPPPTPSLLTSQTMVVGKTSGVFSGFFHSTLLTDQR